MSTRGLSLSDIPRRSTAPGWFSPLIQEFLVSGDEAWEITDDIPADKKLDSARNSGNAGAHRFDCRVVQRGQRLFLIRQVSSK